MNRKTILAILLLSTAVPAVAGPTSIEALNRELAAAKADEAARVEASNQKIAAMHLGFIESMRLSPDQGVHNGSPTEEGIPGPTERAASDTLAEQAARGAATQERISAMQLALTEAARLSPGQGTDPQAGCDAQGKSEFEDGCRLVWMRDGGEQRLAWVRGVWANGQDTRPATLGVDGKFY